MCVRRRNKSYLIARWTKIDAAFEAFEVHFFEKIHAGIDYFITAVNVLSGEGRPKNGTDPRESHFVAFLSQYS